MAQSGQPDVVCKGTSKNYYVNATSGSSYLWKINEGNPESSTTNSVDINWTTTGNFTLTVQERTKNNCVGPVQSLQVTVVDLSNATISGTTVTCQNAASPVVTFTGKGGTAPYTFPYNINDGINKTVTTTTGDTVTVSVPTSVFGTFAYNLVNVTDSRGCTNVQTGTATITINMPTYSSITNVTTCPHALPYIWKGKSYDKAGNYTIRFTNSKGCDSIATLILNVKSPLTSTTVDYVCSSLLPYFWNKSLYFESGIYTVQFTNPSGCDSIATLILNVVSPTSSETKEEINSTELPYVWNKIAYTETGTYTAPINYINSAGCDSIAKLILKVNLSTSAVTNASICASELPYIWNGTPYSTAGTYTKMMTNVYGDNVPVTLHLNVQAATSISQTIHLFNGETYSINGKIYDKEGKYFDELKTVNGCDSLIETNLFFENIPNTMTPNAVGKKDVFMKGSHVQIFNRNGILISEGQDGWDGQYKGKPVSQDTYFYVLYYISEGKTKTKEGYIMVIQ